MAINLGDVISEIRYGTGTPPPYLEPGPDTVPFVRATDIKDGEVITETLFHIAAKQPNHMEKCRLRGGELIIVRSGVNTGDCAVVPASLEGSYAAYDLILTFRDKVSARYISIFLNTEIGKLQLNLVRGRAAQPHVNVEEVAALRLPLPGFDIQTKLVAAMDAARADYKAKLVEADALLAGLDSFIIDTLGLAPPPKDDRRVFAIRYATAPTRFDPHFHLPTFAKNQRILTDHGAEPLGALASFSDETWKPENHKTSTFRYIEISNVNLNTGEAHWEDIPIAEAPSRARMMMRAQDIIVSLTRPHHGAIARIPPALDGCVASTGFAVLRNFNEKRVMRDYLWCVLRTQMCLSQMLQRASGGNYPAITETELAKVIVAVPKLKVQETIAVEARRRHEEAKRLRAEAESGWQSARRWFEEQLLGPPTP